MDDEMELKEAVNLLLTERPECSDCGYQDTKLRKCALYGCNYARALISVIRKVEKDLKEGDTE